MLDGWRVDSRSSLWTRLDRADFDVPAMGGKRTARRPRKISPHDIVVVVLFFVLFRYFRSS